MRIIIIIHLTSTISVIYHTVTSPHVYPISISHHYTTVFFTEHFILFVSHISMDGQLISFSIFCYNILHHSINFNQINIHLTHVTTFVTGFLHIQDFIIVTNSSIIYTLTMNFFRKGFAYDIICRYA